MKKETKFKIYFSLVALILAKIIEWLFQASWNFETIKSFWYAQIIFILILGSIITLFLYIKESDIYYYTFIVGIAYFLKEIWNLLMIYQHWSLAIAVAIIIEPVFMWAILGYLPYKLFYRGVK